MKLGSGDLRPLDQEGLGELDSLGPVFWWLSLVEWDTVHLGEMALAIPSHTRMSVLVEDWLALDAVFFEELEERHVASELHRSQLIVIPLFTKNIFDVGVLVSSESFSMYMCAIGTHKSS